MRSIFRIFIKPTRTLSNQKSTLLIKVLYMIQDKIIGFKKEKLNSFDFHQTTDVFLEFLHDQHCECIFDAVDIMEKNRYLKYFGPAVYIQLRTNGFVYVGETFNLFARTMQHVRNGVKIVYMGAISVWPLTNDERKDTETFIMGRAMEAGLPLENTDKLDQAMESARKVRELKKKLMDSMEWIQEER